MSVDILLTLKSDEANAMFRLPDFQRTTERLNIVFSKFIEQEQFYKAYSLALDFYDLSKPILDKLQENYKNDLLYDVLLVFCLAEDKERSIAISVMIVDLCKRSEDYEKIMSINKLLMDTFHNPRGTTPNIIIMKEAISAATSLVEKITDELPSDEVVTRICKTLSCLPLCFNDGEFILFSLHRIANLYESVYDAQLKVIGAFLPALRQGLDVLHKHFNEHISVGGLDSEALQGVIEVCEEYINILFGGVYPELIGAEPYRLNTEVEHIDKHLNMLREEQIFYNELMHLGSDKMDRLSEYKARYERLFDYFFTVELGEGHYSDIDVIGHLIYCTVAWRKVDNDFALKTVEPYAQTILDFVANDSTPTGAIYSIQTNLTYLSEVYAYAKNAVKEYQCHLQFLRLGNVYLKRICFENGVDYFNENTKQEYFFYHYNGLINQFLNKRIHNVQKSLNNFQEKFY